MTGCYLDRAGMSSSNPPRNWEAFRFVWDWRLFRNYTGGSATLSLDDAHYSVESDPQLVQDWAALGL